MHQAHWGIQYDPFGGLCAPGLFYQSPAHEEALARLHFLVEQRRRFGLLLGASGSGKTLLLEVLAQRLRRDGLAVAKLSLLGVKPDEMLFLLAGELKVNLEPSDSMSRLWRAVTGRLAEHRYQQLTTVVLLDDADRASRPVLDQVVRLAQHDPTPEARLTIILAAQGEQMGHLGPRLLDLTELRIDIQPWEQSDTQEFLNASLAQAGRRSPIFDEPAVQRLHELAHGVPRRISQLADLALLAGAGRELQQVDADVVESAYAELAAH